MKERPTLTAYHLYSGTPSMPLVPAERVRDWMEATPDKFVKRCLPLLIANQAGFVILNSHAITVTWTGGVDKSALHIESGSAGPGLAVSHFGSGVITWNIPWLFRTSEGYNLLVRGPANLPKDGVSALEGVVETDWSCATFTMNWKVTRPGVPIVFAVGEPIALLVPQKRGELEAFETAIKPISDNAELHEGYTAWASGRASFLHDLNVPGSDAVRAKWQKDYFQGKGIDGHQTKLKLCPFEREHS